MDINQASAAPGDGVQVVGVVFREDLLEMLQWFMEERLPLHFQNFGLLISDVEVEAPANGGITIKFSGVAM
jgi:hypothetical protein